MVPICVTPKFSVVSKGEIVYRIGPPLALHGKLGKLRVEDSFTPFSLLLKSVTDKDFKYYRHRYEYISELLDPIHQPSSSTKPFGSARIRAIYLRLQSLKNKDTSFVLPKTQLLLEKASRSSKVAHLLNRPPQQFQRTPRNNNPLPSNGNNISNMGNMPSYGGSIWRLR